MAYKKNIDDIRESPALDILHLLHTRGGEISYSDPYVPALELAGMNLQSQPLCEAAAKADCVVIVTDHADFDYETVVRTAPLIVDTRNALRRFRSEKIVRL